MAFSFSLPSWIILYSISEDTNPQLSEPKATDPAWSFLPHRLFAARLTSGIATTGMRDPQMVFNLVQRMSEQEKLPYHSFLGSGLATSLRLQFLRSRMEELLALNREA